MTRSKLCTKSILSPNHSGKRTQKVSKITIHHMAGIMSAEQCANLFKNPNRQASCQYAIGNQGEIVQVVDEDNRAWTSSSDWNDQRAITFEVSNDNLQTWSISKKAWDSMIALCADICDRYGIVPHYTGDSSGTLTEHRMFAATACPGNYIHKYLANGTIEKEIKERMKSAKKTGWIKDSKGYWYKRTDGSYPKNEWEKINGKWYHFDSNGYMQTGWIHLKNKWYFLKSSGAMATGWIKDENKWYYLLDDGAMVTGKRTNITATFNSSGVLQEG